MIILYYNPSYSSCRKVAKWFNDHNIEFETKDVKSISKVALFNMLRKSENGFEDILKNKNQSHPVLQKILENIFQSSFNDALDLILNNPEVIKIPLILSNHKILTGYNPENIRIFLPKEYRKYRKLL